VTCGPVTAPTCYEDPSGAGRGTVGFSFATIVLQILAPVFFPEKTPRGFTMMLCFILFLGGIPLLCRSIIGSYLAHIYDEVKRPLLYRRERSQSKNVAKRKWNERGCFTRNRSLGPDAG